MIEGSHQKELGMIEGSHQKELGMMEARPVTNQLRDEMERSTKG